MKSYISKYCVSLNVRLADGGYKHVAFSPVTGGGSRFCTGDLEVQEAMERHPKFGRLFSAVETAGTAGPAAEPPGTVVNGGGQVAGGGLKAGPAAEPPGTSVNGGDADGDGGLESEDAPEGLDGSEAAAVGGDGRTVRADSLSEAREYLSEHFGISRTKMRSRAAIVEAAEGVGVRFEGI
ncbi:MAG: hypothetical protein ACI4OZ_09145 [Akkermansia sp.]